MFAMGIDAMNSGLFVSPGARAIWLSVKWRIRNGIGWCLERTKAPAKLSTFEFVDPASDETVYLYTSKRYSVLCVGERRFYFDRVSGKFDGVSAPAGLVPNWAEFSD
jgi:hypothetical protein